VDGSGGTQTLLQTIELGIRHSKCRVIRLIQNFVQRTSARNQVGGSKFRFPSHLRKTPGHQVVICHHIGATIVVVWHCICVKQVHEHSQQDSKSISCTFTSTVGVLAASGGSKFRFPNLPVLVKAIPCIGKDLGISTVAYAPLMVQLQQDGYTTLRETEPLDSYVWVWLVTFLCSIFLPVLVKAFPCIGSKDLGMCIVYTHGGVTTR